MKKRTSPIGLILLSIVTSCNGGKQDAALTLTGVAAADMEAIRTELAGIEGVSDVRVERLKDGQADLRVRFDGKASELASKLGRCPSGLKNVTSFDETSLSVAYAGGPPAATSSPASSSPAATTPPVAPETAVLSEKTTTAHKTHAVGGATIATFEGWELQEVPPEEGWTRVLQHPEGHEEEFKLITGWAGAGREDLASFFDEGPKLIRQMLPGLRAVGTPRKTRYGGDEALVEEFEGESDGQKAKVQVIYVRKKDLALFVLGAGLEEAYPKYAHTMSIVAENFTVKPTELDPAIIGTWSRTYTYGSGEFMGSTHRAITILADGSFRESSAVSAGDQDNSGLSQDSDRGRVVCRGGTLSFHYDNGRVWRAAYKVYPGQALEIDDTRYFKE